MADGAYERRGPREAELKRFSRIIAGVRCASDAVRKADVKPVEKLVDRSEEAAGKQSE